MHPCIIHTCPCAGAHIASQLHCDADHTCAAVQAKIEGLLCRRNEVLEADTSAPVAGEGTMDNAADFEMRIGDAHRKVEATRKRFERLRTVCISADQALKGMHARSQVALREIHPSELTPASKIPHGTPPRSTKRLERRERCGPFHAHRLCLCARVRMAHVLVPCGRAVTTTTECSDALCVLRVAVC